MKSQKITMDHLAKELDVTHSQIYKWNREGISINCKHYLKLKTIIPELQPKEITITKYGKEDTRFKAGRPRKHTLVLTEVDSEPPTETEFTSDIFPRIKIKNKTT